MNDIKLMNKAADNIRILAASMVEKAKSGHPGGAMGGQSSSCMIPRIPHGKAETAISRTRGICRRCFIQYSPSQANSRSTN